MEVIDGVSVKGLTREMPLFNDYKPLLMQSQFMYFTNFYDDDILAIDGNTKTVLGFHQDELSEKLFYILAPP